MASIHALPVPADRCEIDRITELLTGALAEGVDLGPRGHHIRAIACTLETQVRSLRRLMDEIRDIPVQSMAGMGELQDQLLQLSVSISKLAEMSLNLIDLPHGEREDARQLGLAVRSPNVEP